MPERPGTEEMTAMKRQASWMAGARGEGETGNRGLRPEPVDATGLMGPVQHAFLRQPLRSSTVWRIEPGEP